MQVICISSSNIFCDEIMTDSSIMKASTFKIIQPINTADMENAINAIIRYQFKTKEIKITQTVKIAEFFMAH